MIFALFGILITSIGVSSVFAENGIIDVSTDKSNYSDGDVMIISGEIINVNMSNSGSVLGYSNGDLSLEDNEPIILPRPHPISKIFECLFSFFSFNKKILKDWIYLVDEIHVL